MSFRHAIAPALIGLSAALAVVACGPQHANSLSKAHNEQAAEAIGKQLASKCLPASTSAQVSLARSLRHKQGRHALEVKCGIAPANKARFESELLSATEHGYLTTHAGRITFFNVTLPGLVKANQG